MRVTPHTNSPVPLHADLTTTTESASTGANHTGARPLVPAPFSTPSYSAAGLHGRLQIAPGGEWARVTMPQPGPPQRREWRRGNVTTFSARSRSRLLQAFAKTDQRVTDPDAVFVTLTYPREYPSSVRCCKAHLESWRKRVERRHPDAWFFWKLEFQARGATHFHLLLFNAGTVNVDQLHDIWFEIVDSGDEHHWAYGTDVQRCHGWKQAGAYCAKYVAKEATQQLCEGAGRFWGIATRKNRVANVIEAEITESEFYSIRRIFKRLIGAKRGYHAPGGPSSGVWVRCNNQTAKRALEYASSALPATPSHPPPDAHGTFSANDTRAPCSVPSSTAGWTAAEQSRFVRTGRTPTGPLFDSLDCQRARSRWLTR